jgi:phage-related baseplate assembly protein
MSDLVLAEKDPAVVLAGVLARYKALTGTALQPADPRRLLIQAIVLELAQQRALIDFSGKQSFLRYVTSVYIAALAELWGEAPLPAEPSETTLRFTAAAPGILTIPAGVRATDGKNLWAVVETTTSEPAAYVDCLARCTVDGSQTNDVAIGQIDTIVDKDPIPGISTVTNLTETISGRNVEGTEAFRERLRSVPESRSTCGPRMAYSAAALDASSSVADAVAIGPEDGGSLAGATPDPGEVHVLLLEGTRDAEGNLTAVVPEPSSGLLAAVLDALSAEDVRPLTDYVSTEAPSFVDFDISATYYIARSRSRSAVEIQAAVADAFAGYELWQQSKIGRDIDPDELITRLKNAGAKRLVVTLPTFRALMRDESARLVYVSLVYGGIEDD